MALTSLGIPIDLPEAVVIIPPALVDNTVYKLCETLVSSFAEEYTVFQFSPSTDSSILKRPLYAVRVSAFPSRYQALKVI